MRWSESFTTPSSSSYHLGSGTRIDAAAGYAVLTAAEASRSGSLFLAAPLLIAHFDVSFRGWFGQSTSANGGGADGIVFAFAPLYNYPESGGGTLNFDGCLGYGVEFDTYQNSERSDRSPEHVALIKDQSSNHLVSEILAPPTLEDGRWHDLRIRFRAGIVEVFIDGTRRLDAAIPDFTAFDGYFGFTSATGFAWNEHRIDNVSLSLPTRRATLLPPVNLCDASPRETDFLLRNNHPDGTPLLVTSISLISAQPDVFAIAGNPAPATIAAGAELRIPLRLTPSVPGDYSAVLKIEAANGETVYDTVRFIADIPVLEWSPAAVGFPVTWVGDTSVVTATLRNTGRVPAEIFGQRWQRDPGSAFSTTSVLSAMLAPGDSLAVTLRFAPTGFMNYEDSLYLRTSCGEAGGLRVWGMGENERIFFSLRSPLVLSPGEIGDLVVVLDSLPRRVAVEDVRFELNFDPAFTLLESTEKLPGGLSPDAVIGAPTLVGSVASFTISEPGGIRVTGALFAIRLRAAANGPECRDLNLKWSLLRPYNLFGDADGRVCINPSCRLPDGLHRAAVPDLSASPQPARDMLNVAIDAPTSNDAQAPVNASPGVDAVSATYIPAAIAATLRLYDARGREVGMLFDGMVDRSGVRLAYSLAGVANGYYYLLLRCSLGERMLPVIVRK